MIAKWSRHDFTAEKKPAFSKAQLHWYATRNNDGLLMQAGGLNTLKNERKATSS